VNVITNIDGASLMADMAMLPDCLAARRTAQWALGLAQKARDDLDIYIEHDAAERREEADRRVARCLVKLTEAEVALSEKQREMDLRNAQDAGLVTIPTHRARHMRDEANAIAAWLTKPILHKPTDFDIHAQIEMQRKIAWISDMLTAAMQPMSIVDN
jgi:hypothetical protein